LNTCKRVIKWSPLINCDTQEILSELKSQVVIDIFNSSVDDGYEGSRNTNQCRFSRGAGGHGPGPDINTGPPSKQYFFVKAFKKVAILVSKEPGDIRTELFLDKLIIGKGVQGVTSTTHFLIEEV